MHRTVKIPQSSTKSLSLIPFPVTNFLPEVELMHVLRMCGHYRHKRLQKRCRAPEMTMSLYENGFGECKYDVGF